jgi:hypothetical protein
MWTHICLKNCDRCNLSKKAYYSAQSQNATLLKVVVSPTGQAINKNYDRNGLQAGDIGLELRLDRNQVEKLTPEQRHTTLQLAREMSKDLLVSLGDKSGCSFEPETVVAWTVEDDEKIGIVQSSTDNGLVVKQVIKLQSPRNESYYRSSLTRLPFATFAVEEADSRGCKGWEGVFLALGSSCSLTTKDFEQIKNDSALATILLQCDLDSTDFTKAFTRITNNTVDLGGEAFVVWKNLERFFTNRGYLWGTASPAIEAAQAFLESPVGQDLDPELYADMFVWADEDELRKETLRLIKPEKIRTTIGAIRKRIEELEPRNSKEAVRRHTCSEMIEPLIDKLGLNK